MPIDDHNPVLSDRYSGLNKTEFLTKQEAATKIQGIWRGYTAMKEAKQKYTNPSNPALEVIDNCFAVGNDPVSFAERHIRLTRHPAILAAGGVQVLDNAIRLTQKGNGTMGLKPKIFLMDHCADMITFWKLIKVLFDTSESINLFLNKLPVLSTADDTVINVKLPDYTDQSGVVEKINKDNRFNYMHRSCSEKLLITSFTYYKTQPVSVLRGLQFDNSYENYQKILILPKLLDKSLQSDENSTHDVNNSAPPGNFTEEELCKLYQMDRKWFFTNQQTDSMNRIAFEKEGLDSTNFHSSDIKSYFEKLFNQDEGRFNWIKMVVLNQMIFINNDWSQSEESFTFIKTVCNHHDYEILVYASNIENYTEHFEQLWQNIRSIAPVLTVRTNARNHLPIDTDYQISTSDLK